MGHAEAVMEMIDVGCDVTVQDKTGATALHWASARGNLAAGTSTENDNIILSYCQGL